MPRFSVYIADPEIVTPYVGIARLELTADDEPTARLQALDTYNRVATGSFVDDDIRLVAQLAAPGSEVDTW